MALAAIDRDHLVHGLHRSRAGSAEMDIWHRISSWFFCARREHAAGHHPVDADTADELPCEPEKPWGCGWFDSSLDLRLGLKVIENPGADLALAVEQMLRVEPTA